MNTRTAGNRPRREANTAWAMPCGRRHSRQHDFQFAVAHRFGADGFRQHA